MSPAASEQLSSFPKQGNKHFKTQEMLPYMPKCSNFLFILSYKIVAIEEYNFHEGTSFSNYKLG